MSSPRYFFTPPELGGGGGGCECMCVWREMGVREGCSIPRGGQHKSKGTKTHPYLAELLSPLTAECTEGGPQ